MQKRIAAIAAIAMLIKERTMKNILLSICLVFCVSCKTIVERHYVDENTVQISSNAKCITEYTKKVDGEEIWKIDTKGQNIIDKVKTGIINVLNYLGRTLSNVQPTIRD